MSSMTVFQTFMAEQAYRSKMDLNNPLTALLQYLQYLIRTDFNANDKAHLVKKNRKNQIGKEFRSALTTLSRQEKIYYYCLVLSYLKNFISKNFNPPKSNFSGILNNIGFSRSFNIKRWKQKKMRLDMDKHLMFAQRQQKLKTYDLRNYILRRSKNKDYNCFVLQAINNIPHQKSLTVHIGFTDISVLNEWLAPLRFSIDLRLWEFFKHMYGSLKMGMNSARVFSTDDIGYNKSMGNFKIGGTDEKDNYRDMSSSMIENHNNHKEIEYQKFTVGDMILTDDLKSSNNQIKIKVNKIQKKQETTQMKEKYREREKIQNELKVYEEVAERRKTYIDELIEGEIFQQPDIFEEKMQEESEQLRQNKKNIDLFHKLYPEYQLDELQIFANFEVVHDSPQFKIYQHTILDKRVKLLALFDKSKYSREQVLSMISKPETAGQFNDNIQSVQLKTFIPSENSALMYQLNKPYNRLYRARDFVFIRHVFSHGDRVYMIDKSIENGNYPPFMTIVRASFCNVYGLFERNNRIELIVDFQLKHEGILNPVQQNNLSLKYIKGYLKMFETQAEVNLYKFFQLDWDISKNKSNDISNQIRTRRKTLKHIDRDIVNIKQQQIVDNRNFNKKTVDSTIKAQNSPVMSSSEGFGAIKVTTIDSSSNNSSPLCKRDAESPNSSTSPEHLMQTPKKKMEVRRFDSKTMEEVGEIGPDQIKNMQVSCLKVVNQLNAQGLVIIRDSYRKHHYILEPLPDCKKMIMPLENGLHPIWKDEWRPDNKEGYLLFVHQKKIKDQKGVLSFVLSKIAKNLVSGQSVTNISLPVDIFSCESNLERYLYSFSYAPLLLEGLQKENLLNRMARTFVFGLTNSILYLSMEKPFNPILGQTFQSWINGCPAYAQQISHHPPIAALMMKGRGYSISGQFESKVNLGMNSGTGINDGIYRVKFTDGMEICFMTPGGEISGLTRGDRKFSLSGKSYYWVSNTNIMMQVGFDPYKKGVFSFGKQEKPVNYLEGTIWQVKPEFMEKFLKGKRRQPEDKQRIQMLGKISGMWDKYVLFNNTEIFSFDKQFPIVMEYQKNPLPSDANWRQDIEYRRRLLVPRAQTQKERLQVIQRKDRKQREKYNKKKK